MNLGQRIRSSVKWLFVGSVGNQILQFGFGVVLARLLAPADFGMLVTIQLFTGVAGLLAAGGMGQALVQAKNATARDFEVIFTLQLLVCTAICLFFIAIAPWFADWFADHRYADLLRVSALSFLLRPFVNIPGAKLQREMRFKEVSIIRVFNLCMASLASIGLAIAGLGVWSLVLGGLMGSSINIAILMVVSKWRPSFGYDTGAARRVWSYGAKVTANDLVCHFRFQTCNFIISRAEGAAAVGFFNKADSLSMIPPQLVSVTAYQAMFRALSSVQDNLDRSKYLYLRALTLVTLYCFPLSIGLWWGAGPFVRIVYGAKWLDSVAILEVLAWSGLFLCIENQSGAVIAAQNRLGTELYIQSTAFVLAILGCAVAVHFGLTYVAWALLGVNALSCIALAALACRVLRVRVAELAHSVTPAIVLSAIMLAALFLAQELGLDRFCESHPIVYLAGTVVAGGVAYALAFMLLPFENLRTEVARWKRVFSFSGKPAEDTRDPPSG